MSGDLIALGPGKVDLLESIDNMGSISEAARQSNISYRRAWDMVDTMNQCFNEPFGRKCDWWKRRRRSNTHLFRKKDC